MTIEIIFYDNNKFSSILLLWFLGNYKILIMSILVITKTICYEKNKTREIKA